ncbi:Rid family hydrolase [Roseinatronobacter sp. NSM]|uniref:Rid family hydrolase n=1 Tax=Roseinatronobacter sp. NSM TaxID=3457785 RepID=UPI0040350BC5
MSIHKTGRIDSWGPKIFLGSAAGDIASVCLTAPDKAADFATQTRDILDVIDDLLGQMGSGHDQIVQVQVWLADMGDWPAFVPVWNDWVDPAAPPGLSVVQMQASRRDALLEIRAWAMRAPDPA